MKQHSYRTSMSGTGLAHTSNQAYSSQDYPSLQGRNRTGLDVRRGESGDGQMHHDDCGLSTPKRTE